MKLLHTNGSLIAESPSIEYNATQRGWDDGATIHYDPDKKFVVDGDKPIISPPQMRLLYTSEERVFIRSNLKSAAPDPVINDFFTELSDPQLTQVDLNLKSVQGAIEYSLNFVAPHMNPPYTAETIEARKLEMLTGAPK